MSRVRQLKEKPEIPKALVCGILEDGGRILFLLKRGRHCIERLTLPCAPLFPGDNPVALLTEEFRFQTGIDAETGEMILEKRWNAGSRKRKRFVSVFIFEVSAKNRQAKPSKEFSGFKWARLDDAKGGMLDRRIEWIRNVKLPGKSRN